MSLISNYKGLPSDDKSRGKKSEQDEKVLECIQTMSSGNSDESVQFEADQFIQNRFNIKYPKKKKVKEPIRGIAEAVASQAAMGFTHGFHFLNTPNNTKKENQEPVEDVSRRIVSILKPSAPMETLSEGDLWTENMKELNTLLQAAHAAYDGAMWNTAANKYTAAYRMITDTTMKTDDIDEDIVCFMLCLTWLKSGQLSDLMDAVQYLIELEKKSSTKFPAVFYALSRAHYLLHRFALACETIEKGFDFLKQDIEFKTYCIPGTSITLLKTTREGLLVSLLSLKDDCSSWHPPDAVCCMSECLDYSQHYAPSREIFFSDPTFNGMVVVTCSNSRHPCVMKFHQTCWKSKKDELFVIKKLSDKDLLGYVCFTPNCENDDGVQSVIAKVEIIGEDGQVKAHVEASEDPTIWTKRTVQPKGAIPKQTARPKRQTERPRKPTLATTSTGPSTTTTQPSTNKEAIDEETEREWRVAKFRELRNNNFGKSLDNEWRPDKKMFGNKQLIEIGDFLPGPDFTSDYPGISDIKSFVFTYFYEYIKGNGPVEIKELEDKWEEDKHIFQNYECILTNGIDICEFLLQSYKLTAMGNYISTSQLLPEVYTLVKFEVSASLNLLLENELDDEELEIKCDEIYDRFMAEPYNDDVPRASTSEGGTNVKVNCPIDEAGWSDTGFKTSIDNLYSDVNLDAEKIVHKHPDAVRPLSDNKLEEKVPQRYLVQPHNEVIGLSENVARLQAALDEEKERGRKYRLGLQEEVNKLRKIDQERLSTLMADIHQLEEYNATLTSEKNEIEKKYHQLEENYTTLKLEYAEILYKSEVLYKEKCDVEHNLCVLSREKKMLDTTIEGLQKERDRMDKKFQKYHSRLKDKSAELESFHSKQEEMLKDAEAAIKLKERTARKDSLYWEFVANETVINAAMQKCGDYIKMLNDISGITMIRTGGQPFQVSASLRPWQQTLDCLKDISDKHKAEYFRLKALLESDVAIERMEYIRLQLPDEPSPPPSNIMDVLRAAFNAFQKHNAYTQMAMQNQPHPLYIPQYTNMSHLMNQVYEQRPMLQNIKRATYSPGPIRHPFYREIYVQSHANMNNNQHLQPHNNMTQAQPKHTLPHDNSDDNNQTLHSRQSNPSPVLESSNPFHKNGNVENKTEQVVNDHDRQRKILQDHEVMSSEKNENDRNTTVETNNNDETPYSSSVNSNGSITEVSANSEMKRRKTIGLDGLMQQLKNKFIGVLESDLLDSIEGVRKMHNNSLSGMRIPDIISEAEEFIIKSQEKQLCHYTQTMEMQPHERPVGQMIKYNQLQSTVITSLEQNRQPRKGLQQLQTPGKITRNSFEQIFPSKVTPTAMIKKPAWATVSSGLVDWKKVDEEPECTICYDPMEKHAKDAPVYTLQCQHSFHTACIKKWLGENRVCPICRVHCTMDDEFPPLPS